MPEIQYVSDETGNPTAVIVLVELWREIESEKETAYLLKSETMKQLLLEAKDREPEFHLRKPLGKLEFDFQSPYAIFRTSSRTTRRTIFSNDSGCFLMNSRRALLMSV